MDKLQDCKEKFLDTACPLILSLSATSWDISAGLPRLQGTRQRLESCSSSGEKSMVAGGFWHHEQDFLARVCLPCQCW